MLPFVLIVLCAAVANATERATLLCYGEHFKKTIGLSKEDTSLSLHCSTCTKQELCSSDGIGDFCSWISDNEIRFFDNDGGVLQDPLPLSDCTPVSIQDAAERGFVVKCASTPTEYQPTRQYFFDREYASVFELGPHQTQRTGRMYAPQANNYALLNVDHSEYIISFVPDSNKIVIEYGSAPYEKTILGCSTIHDITAGPIDGENIQVVVTCNSTEGGQARKRVSILEHNLQAEPVIDSLYDPLPNDIVWFEGAYIVYRGSTRVVVIRTSAITADPAIIEAKNGANIDGVSFLSDSQLLLSVNEQPFEVLDVPTYFTSSFENGRTVLANSEAYCPEGHCTPHRVNEKTLFLFSKDSSSYLVLMSYDLNDLSADPTRISRSVIEDEFDVCFKITADIPVIETDPPPTTPPPTIPSPETTDAPDETIDTPGTAPPSVVPVPLSPSENAPLPSGAIAGIVMGCILAVLVLGAVMAIVGGRLEYRRKRKRSFNNIQPTSPEHAEVRYVGIELEHLQLPSVVMGGNRSHSSSKNPSSTASLASSEIGEDQWPPAPTQVTDPTEQVSAPTQTTSTADQVPLQATDRPQPSLAQGTDPSEQLPPDNTFNAHTSSADVPGAAGASEHAQNRTITPEQEYPKTHVDLSKPGSATTAIVVPPPPRNP